ncbi:MAG TPA: carboxymuconolactone decarboxylase family protein [Gammaproteobacteria bacterium]|nr:carboxymuconolactone decarboxylase family protein [Gammaproteobacteria bacterium]
MNLMHMVIFSGTDGEEHWQTFLSLKQKEFIALALSQYYQCEYCIQHHLKEVHRLVKTEKKTLSKNINAIVLFLRIDTHSISKTERESWTTAWQKFAGKVSTGSSDQTTPYLIGLAIGIARNDEFLIELCGTEVIKMLTAQDVNPRSAIGELESLVIFMKAAASKNRVAYKLEQLLR